jgi:hypothetical protein
VHNVTVYATDKAGNIGASKTIVFNLTEPEPEIAPFLTSIVAASSVIAAVVCLGLLRYFKRRKG